MTTAIASVLERRYRRLTRAQLVTVWAIAAVFGAYIPLVIRVTGVTRTHGGFDLRPPWALFIAAVTLVVGLFVVTAPERAPAEAGFAGGGRFILAYAALPFAVFSVYVVAFYPALMSDDSYYQWDQVVTGKFNASLPFAHTLLYWVAARFWKSPAAPALAQSLALAVTFGASMVELRRAGAPRALTWVLTAGFALLPLNGAMAVSLWKDVAFSTAILWLTLIVFRIVVSRGEVMRERWTQVQLALALVLVTLIRANGPVPAFATACALLGCYPKAWRSVLVAAAGAVFLILFVNVGLARATGESFDGEGVYKASPFIWDIGAVLQADLHVSRISVGKKARAEFVWRDRTVTPDERGILQQFDDVVEWARLYQRSMYPYWHTRRAHWNLLDDPEKRGALMHVWFDLARRNPGIVFRHRVDAARIGWLIDADDVDASIIATNARSDRLHQPVVPPFAQLTQWFDDLVSKTILNPHWQAFIAFPALATYLTLLFFVLDAVRRRSWRFLAVATPLASNWLITMAFCMAQDARYFYASFVVLPFAVGLPWTAAGDRAKVVTS